MFSDNAGIIRFNERYNIAYKVETHNSPSALDPYGGAITGIVGVNRDPFGTGLGADLLANVWGYCFASPFHEGPIPKGLLHPRRIRDGVHAGVIDGVTLTALREPADPLDPEVATLTVADSPSCFAYSPPIMP